jgi:hypothetical protein
VCGACGRLGFGEGTGDAPGTLDLHLRVASGGSIAPLVDLTGVVPYNPADFVDGSTEVRANDPSYLAALYRPFGASLAVIAGRSVIEIAADGGTVVHAYRPAVPDTTGPDAPGRATFANLGAGKVGLWLTSSSMSGGDGLYLIAPDWSIAAVDITNNTYPLALDPTGGYDRQGVAAMYFGARTTLERETGTTPAPVGPLPGVVDDLAALGDALFMTVEDGDQIALDRVGPGPGYLATQLMASTDMTLAEGSTEAGLFGIHDDFELVSISPSDGALTPIAWTDDRGWVWRSVSAPRAGHPLAGDLIVLESNRTLGRDRLLRITPP